MGRPESFDSPEARRPGVPESVSDPQPEAFWRLQAAHEQAAGRLDPRCAVWPGRPSCGTGWPSISARMMPDYGESAGMVNTHGHGRCARPALVN